MAGEGFNTERPGDLGAHDPGRAAREAADRIAEQVRDILGSAEQRAGEIRSAAESDAERIRENAAGAAARMLERVDSLEEQLEVSLTEFFDSIRRELEGLAPREAIEAAAAGQQQQQQQQQPQPYHPPPQPDQRTQELGQLDEPRFEPRPQAEPGSEPEPEPMPHPAAEPGTELPARQPAADEEPRRRRGLLWGRRERGPEDAQAAPAGGDAEDAHVMALNMALNGTPREETEGYLLQRFGRIEDLGSILDDVYGRVRRG